MSQMPTPTSISLMQQNTQSLTTIVEMGLMMQTVRAFNGTPLPYPSPPTRRGRLRILSARYRPVSKAKPLPRRDVHLPRNQSLQKSQRSLHHTMAIQLNQRRRPFPHFQPKETRRLQLLMIQDSNVKFYQEKALRFPSRLGEG